ncbi:MAG TPA: hypothetical protein VGN26_03850 [Armatimonadota bacterium]|jgi:hypothetical protein
MKISKKWTLGLLTIAGAFFGAMGHGLSLKEAAALAAGTAWTLIYGQSKIDAAKVQQGTYER